MFKLGIAWLIPVAFTFVGFASNVKSAIAQTTFPFDVVYRTDVKLEPIPSTDILVASVVGFNPEAPYGLTNLTSVNNYSRFDPTTNVFTFTSDPARFGLEGFPTAVDTFFGSGDDRLIGSSEATATIDSATNTLNGTGIITITGGTGRFTGATGILNFSESESLDQDPTADPLRGQAFLSGSFQVPQRVPEPSTNMTLAGIGVIGTGFLLRRRRLQSVHN